MNSVDWAEKDRERGQQLLDSFIEVVNADHDDVIRIPREKACLMRDEIQRLREVAGEIR